MHDSAIVDILQQMPDLRVLYLKGNDVCGKIKSYSRRVIASIPSLTHLDDCPRNVKE